MSLVDRFRQAPPGRQAILAGIAVVLTAAIMVGVYLVVLRTEYAVLFRDLRAGDAATIVAELERSKTPYRLRDGGGTILVSEDVVDSTRLQIMGQELPLKGAIGFELFNKSDMGLTEFAQRINYQRALQGELARTIMTVDAVDTARVHLAITEPTVFRSDRRPPKASVTLTPRPGRQLTPETVRGVQRLVAAAVPELDLANVVVLNGRGEVVSGTGQPVPDALSADVGQKQAVELYYAARVREAVAHLYPQGGVEVTAAAAAQVASDPGGTLAPAPLEFEDWSPQDRRFRLRIVLSAPPPLDAERQEALRTLAADAIGQGEIGGDVITVLAADQPLPATSSAGLAQVEPALVLPETRKAADVSPRGFWVSILLAALVVLGGAAFLLRRGRATPRRLRETERDAYARRLTALLEEGDAHAARP